MPKPAFYDLFIDIQEEHIEDVLLFSKHLGYKGIGINLRNEDIKDIRQIETKLINLAKETNIDICFRTPYDVVKKLNVNRDELKTLFSIIYIDVKTRKDFESALKNPYINIISLQIDIFSNIISQELINLLLQRPDKLLEIRLSKILKVNAPERASILYSLYRKIDLLRKPAFKFIISSQAESLTEMISPRMLRSFLRILGLKEEKILEAISLLPSRIIKQPWPIIIQKIEG